MGLLSRSKTPRTPTPASKRRPPAPRVRLRADEIKRSNRLTPRDRLIGYIAALYGAAVFVIIGVNGGFEKNESARMSLGIGLAVGMAIIAWKFSSRISLSLGAVSMVMWITVGWQRDTLAGLLAYPILGFMLYLMLTMSNTRRRIIKERIDAGDFGDPRAEARAARTAGTRAPSATSTPDGRPTAPPSKRYTPPKGSRTTIRKR
jgi:hypothetical protein